jgi:hypothetical protein
MGAVLFVTPYFYKTVNPPPVTRKIARRCWHACRNPPAPVATVTKAVRKGRVHENPPGDLPRVAAEKEDTFVVDTDVPRGFPTGPWSSWLLKKFATNAGSR